MSEVKHTATPWTARMGHSEFGVDYLQGVVGPDGKSILIKGFALSAGEECEANTAFIVKAVNCHEQMLAALKAARLAFKVEYANDGRVLSVAYDSEALRPLVADLDATIAAAGDA